MSAPKPQPCRAIVSSVFASKLSTAKECGVPAAYACEMCRRAYCSSHVADHEMMDRGLYVLNCGLDSPAGKRYTAEPTPTAPPSP